ncbi:BlaI/MecI/CopY family transcriptional regulator [Soonwooa sp.]|uniref:BlaI/MecI/CopY family transcriptional regulator n=1 Tax=Soonwooa sp. TaxID=1938592 RepID=UPI0026088789|nr:BlaI/MecI/CopY family transcriptional regulator [Soonwooa sp.]
MKILSLTSSEEQLMLVIWNLDSAFMKDVMTAYPEPKPHQNTVSTFLKILVEKNYLKIEKKGRIYKYIPKISFEEYRKFQLHNLLENLYHEDVALLLKDLNVNEAPPKVEVKSIETIIAESTQVADAAIEKEAEMLDADTITLDETNDDAKFHKKKKDKKEKKEKKKSKHKKGES